jgi:signal peptide peptidase SppA
MSSFLATLIASPWALRRELLPVVSRVLSRLARGEAMSPDDRQAVEDGKRAAAARRQQSEYAGGSGDIALVPVYGLLTQRGGFVDLSEPTTSMSALASTITKFAAMPSVAAIVLDVDSPGGSVYGVQELGDAIYAARDAKPVVAVANSLAASAAYWVASQASEFYAAPGAEVGSIGVYMIHANVAEALKQDGVEVTLISAGKYKTEMSEFGPLAADARAHQQSSIDQYYDAFIRAVARGRGTTQKAVREGMGQGRVLLPDGAKAERMIDGVRTLDQTIARLWDRIHGGGAAARAAGASALAEMQREIAANDRDIELDILRAPSAELAELEEIYGRARVERIRGRRS